MFTDTEIENIRQRLIAHVVRNELSVDRLAKDIGLALNTVSFFLKKKRKPEAKTIARMSNFLDKCRI